MKALFDFHCNECDQVYEKYLDVTLEVIGCECGGKMHKMVSTPSYFKIDGFRADINSEKWAKTRIDNSRRHRDNNGG